MINNTLTLQIGAIIHYALHFPFDVLHAGNVHLSKGLVSPPLD